LTSSFGTAIEIFFFLDLLGVYKFSEKKKNSYFHLLGLNNKARDFLGKSDKSPKIHNNAIIDVNKNIN
jgi:hypothetical protein